LSGPWRTAWPRRSAAWATGTSWARWPSASATTWVRWRWKARAGTTPLALVLADSYTAPRAVLVGDAARGIHPIAGQGWNLALRDVASVAEIAVDRLRLGLDPGDAAALQRYAAWRRFDGVALVAVTDGLNRLFANDLLPLRACARPAWPWSTAPRR
jgi:2-octaprenyl-6-methoxyphenol hydroxylase